MQNMTNMLIVDGGSVKTDQEGVVSGLGIVFGSESEPDQSSQRDFFTTETFVRKSESFTVPLYYNHGIGPIDTEIGEAVLTKQEDGWHAEAKIDTNDPIGAKVYKAVKQKPHGFSTGALQHLVRREAKSNDTHFIEKWVVGEISLTERPAERKAVVRSIKSVDGELVESDWSEFNPIVAVKDKEGEVLWSIENEAALEDFFFRQEKPAETIDVKYTSGTVSYSIYTYDDETGKGAEMYVTEYGSPEEVLNHISDMISKAKFQIKSNDDPETDLEDKIVQIVEKVLEGKTSTSTPEPNTELEQELADVKAKLAEREDEYAQAQTRINALEILAGAKKTLDNIKDK
jgi:phage head maturation protease